MYCGDRPAVVAQKGKSTPPATATGVLKRQFLFSTASVLDSQRARGGWAEPPKDTLAVSLDTLVMGRGLALIFQ